VVAPPLTTASLHRSIVAPSRVGRWSLAR